MIGDNISDIEAGINAKVTPVLVKTGHGIEHIEKVKKLGVANFDNILQFAKSLS